MKQRMLSPDFWGDSELVVMFPYPADYPGRSLYAFLWNLAEDSGVFDPNFMDMKMKFAPGDLFTAQDIGRWYQRLVDNGKVIEFDAQGKTYGWLKRFLKWQRVDNPTPPRLPLPPWVEWRDENKPDEPKRRSRFKYVVLDWDFSRRPPAPRRAGGGRP